MRALALAGVAGILIAAVLPAAPAAAQPLACGAAVTESIVLDRDLTCESGDGLAVQGTNVVLDLNGHTIAGSGTASVGVRFMFGGGATVRNGTIRGFASGVMLDRTRGIHIEDLALLGNRQGIDARRTADVVIEQNRISGSAETGIALLLASRIWIERNVLWGNGVGISDDSTSEIRISLNKISHSGGDGIRISSIDGVVSRNTVHRNGDDGIEVRNPATTVTGNTANRNGDLGIEAVAGVIDGGGNTAKDNGNPAQCTGVTCSSHRP